VIVPRDTPANSALTANVGRGSKLFDAFRGRETGDVNIAIPTVDVEWKKLVEVADLDTVLGYEGNYTIFPLEENNLITLHMMQDYLDVGDELLLRDPDETGDYTIDELQRLAQCLYDTDKDLYEARREELKELLRQRLLSSRALDDRVIVPTSSLYVEALVGTHPLLEDFKLLHRALDVKKVQAEVRHAELENVRLAARALEGEYEDPDIEKKIVIENGSGVVVEPD
jgi:hypothetical protein